MEAAVIHAPPSTPVTTTTILLAPCRKAASVHVGTTKNAATAASHQRFAVHQSEPATQTATPTAIAEAAHHRNFLLPLCAIAAPIRICTSRRHSNVSAPVRVAKLPEYSSGSHHVLHQYREEPPAAA